MSKSAWVTLDSVLNEFVVRMIAAVPDATTANCFLTTLADDPPAPNPDYFIFEVAPGDLRVSDSSFMGGGRALITCEGPIQVVIHNTSQNDESGRDTLFLTDSDNGVIPQVSAVIDAMAGYMLTDTLGATDAELLNHPLAPTQILFPPRNDRNRGTCSVMFDVNFDWLVSSGVVV